MRAHALRRCLFVGAPLAGLALVACGTRSSSGARPTSPAETAQVAPSPRDGATEYARCISQSRWESCLAATIPGPGSPSPARVAEVRGALERGCSVGDARACYLHTLSVLTNLSDEGLRDAVRARLEGACERGVADACAVLGMLQRSGSLAADDASPRGLCERACERGSAHGCTCLAGIMLARASDADDVARARALYRRACSAGSALACRTQGGAVDVERHAERLPPPDDAGAPGSGVAQPVRGLLAPSLIREVVLRHIHEDVRACFEATLAFAPFVEGRLLLRFVIGPEGAVLGAQTVLDPRSFPLLETGDCIAAYVRAWHFPAPERRGVVTVNYPFNLIPE